jgi:hypothetical protein
LKAESLPRELLYAVISVFLSRAFAFSIISDSIGEPELALHSLNGDR